VKHNANKWEQHEHMEIFEDMGKHNGLNEQIKDCLGSTLKLGTTRVLFY